MQHPLLNPSQTHFTTSFDIPPFPEGKCLTGPESIREWLKQAQVHLQHIARTGYSAGTIENATAEDRALPRIIFDGNGRCLGVGVWMPALQGWTIPGQIGQIMTLKRTAATVAEDMAARPLAGWVLCDGSVAAAPDYTEKDGFFDQGETEDPLQWDIYSVMYIGG